MILSRPCTCDRFLRNSPYVAGRDCPVCWLFAHRPSVRSAWGGDARDCRFPPSATPNGDPEELADVLAGPSVVLPEGWKFWRSTAKAHRLLAERFLRNLPAYPDGAFSGRGAIICGGGAYDASVYVACKMLRHVGWEHPIQVWHRGKEEPVSPAVRSLPGVEVVDSEAHPARSERRLLGGWENKSFAILNSPFEEVLFLDADCYPIFNPAECFRSENNPNGIVVWPDVAAGDDVVHWQTYGVPPDGQVGLNGGHYVLRKRDAWPVFQLASHYDNHSDYFYWRSIHDVRVGAFGDQEQVRVALHKLQASYRRYTPRPLLCEFGSYIQAGPGGRPLFVHRCHNKFAAPAQFTLPPAWQPSRLPMEVTAWRYFHEWMSQPPLNPAFPDDVPGWFTQAECASWRKWCAEKSVLELGRHHGRSTVVAAAVASRIVSIDRISAETAEFWLQRYGARQNAWLLEAAFAEGVRTAPGPYDAVLVDGAHDARNVSADIQTVVPVLGPGAVVAFHDYDDPKHPDVRPVVDAAAKQFGWRLLERADFLAVFQAG